MTKLSIKFAAPLNPCGPLSGWTPDRGVLMKQSGRRSNMSAPGLGFLPFDMSAAKEAETKPPMSVT